MHSSALPSPCWTILHILMQRYGIDFTHYQPGSLLRRITLRMERVGIMDYAAYADYLTSASDECNQLVNTILINHTTFFRDPDVWTTIASQCVPQLPARKPAAVPLRIWSYVGALVALFALGYATFLAVETMIFGNPVPGYASIMVSVLFLGGVQLISLGVLGEYVGRILTETKQRPLYVVRDTVGIESQVVR